MKTYGVALIGCGQMGSVHMEHIYYKENIKIKCVCDTDKSRAEEFRRKFNAERTETDAGRCITAGDVDIVIIATYPSTHLPLLKLCIENNKHVICEKPIAANPEEGREFVRLVKENPQIKVQVGHILRYNRTYRTVAEMIQNGAIGSPMIIRMAQNHHTMAWDRYLSLIKETSPVIDCGVHYMDVMQWFSGEKIVDVSAIGAKTESDVPDGKYNYGMVTVRLSKGSIGYYEAGWSNTMSSDNLKEFIGPKGRIRIVYRSDRTSHQEEGDLIEYYRYPEKEYQTININSNRKPTDVQLEHLIDMIENDAPAMPDIDEVFESFSVTLQADACIRRML